VLQHIVVIRPDEATCQGRRYHMVMACYYVGLHLNGGCTPRRNDVQVCNKQGSLGHVTRAQGPHGDQVGPR
jgi:hypothetical protein